MNRCWLSRDRRRSRLGTSRFGLPSCHRVQIPKYRRRKQQLGQLPERGRECLVASLGLCLGIFREVDRGRKGMDEDPYKWVSTKYLNWMSDDKLEREVTIGVVTDFWGQADRNYGSPDVILAWQRWQPHFIYSSTSASSLLTFRPSLRRISLKIQWGLYGY